MLKDLMLKQSVQQKFKKSFAVFTTDRELEANQYKKINKQIDTQIKALVSSRSSHDLFFADYKKSKRPISGLQHNSRYLKKVPTM